MSSVLRMEWTDAGCLAFASGFEGVMLTCPRCHALLPRDESHRCGDRMETTNPKEKLKSPGGASELPRRQTCL